MLAPYGEVVAALSRMWVTGPSLSLVLVDVCLSAKVLMVGFDFGTINFSLGIIIARCADCCRIGVG